MYAHGVGAQSPPSKLHVSTLHAGSHSPSFTQLAGHERVHRSFCGVTSEPLANTQSPMSQPHACVWHSSSHTPSFSQASSHPGHPTCTRVHAPLSLKHASPRHSGSHTSFSSLWNSQPQPPCAVRPAVSPCTPQRCPPGGSGLGGGGKWRAWWAQSRKGGALAKTTIHGPEQSCVWLHSR